MLSLTDEHKVKIREAWGRNNPRILAKTAMGTLFSYDGEIGLDYDDQIDLALYTGILAGDALLGSGKKTVEDFIDHFEKEVLNGEEVY